MAEQQPVGAYYHEREIGNRDKRIAELEAALRESEIVLTAVAMAPKACRTLICDDERLTGLFVKTRKALEK